MSSKQQMYRELLQPHLQNQIEILSKLQKVFETSALATKDVLLAMKLASCSCQIAHLIKQFQDVLFCLEPSEKLYHRAGMAASYGLNQSLHLLILEIDSNVTNVYECGEQVAQVNGQLKESMSSFNLGKHEVS